MSNRPLIGYRSKPILTPSFSAIMSFTLVESAAFLTLSSTLFAKAYIRSAAASFFGIPLD